jgi:hypothetical protein
LEASDAGSCTTEGVAFGFTSFFASHMKVIHRFLGAAAIIGSTFGEALTISGPCAMSFDSTLVIKVVGVWADFAANE